MAGRGFQEIPEKCPLPGIEWRLEVAREQAARYGADVALPGNAVQMVTTGIKVSTYRPEDQDDEVDIRARCLLVLGDRLSAWARRRLSGVAIDRRQEPKAIA